MTVRTENKLALKNSRAFLIEQLKIASPAKVVELATVFQQFATAEKKRSFDYPALLLRKLFEISGDGIPPRMPAGDNAHLNYQVVNVDHLLARAALKLESSL